jgi:hypothetical protein
MTRSHSFSRAAARIAVPAAVAALLAGCATAQKNAADMSKYTNTASSLSSMSMSSGSTASSSTSAMIMPSTDSDGGTVTSMTVGGLRAVPTTVLASATWQGMRITAEARSAVPFVVYNGTSEQEIKPGPNASFHLMVMLNDAQTGVAIPYASVWATIMRADSVVYDERQWPMISRYMGAHYGNNVTLPDPGTYHLSLLVSPPVVARHLEYANVWLKPHRVDFTFRWRPSY